MTLRKQPRKKRRTDQLRSLAHLAWIRRTFRCLVTDCYRTPIEAAHWRLGAHGPLGRKPGDDVCVPLCGGPEGHHAESHRIGERSFAVKYELDIEKAIAELCRQSPALKRLAAKERNS